MNKLTAVLAAVLLSPLSALAQVEPPAEPTPPPPPQAPRVRFTEESPPTVTRVNHRENEWARDARFFAGVRTGVAIPQGARGLAPTLGAEVGVAAKKGLGFGLHFLGAPSTPGVPGLNIERTDYAFGAALDMRFYIQTIEPATLYPTLAIGFLAGPSTATGQNVVLPVINPGFGTRVKLGNIYTSFEFGFAGFQIPFINFAMGWDLDRKTMESQS